MLIAMNEENNTGTASGPANDNDRDREEEKEEEYDYFLDPVKDEGGLNNKGYHLVDAADLETTDQKNSKAKDDDVVDPDEEEDLEKIQDDELR